jgi:hypothetical protein
MAKYFLKLQNIMTILKKVYGTDPLTCPKCLYPMKVVAIIMNSEETKKILQHLIKIGRAPPNFTIPGV